MTATDLPAVNAALNATSTVLLLAGFLFIKTQHKVAHRNCMAGAFLVSCVFLTTYVLHKFLVHGVHTPFGGAGHWKTFYYILLATHVILAMGIVPLILITMTHAVKARYEKHRTWARWTLPLWLYVSVTGVLVYFMLCKWFPKT